jgi:hypothetical protein
MPTGNGTAGGDAIFYVASLRADFSGDGAVTADDKAGFLAAWHAGRLDADFRGVGFGTRPPDGRVTLSDLDGFSAAYQAAVMLGRHLDPLPASVGGLAAGVTELPRLSFESGILVEAAGQMVAVEPAFLLAQPTQDAAGDGTSTDNLQVRWPPVVPSVDAGSGAVLRL